MARTQVTGSQIGDATVTDADVAAANKDGTAATPSMRTLGTGSTQAAAGNHTHAHNTLTGLTAGDDHTQYALLGGRSGGQVLYGGTAVGDNLALIPNFQGVLTGHGATILYGGLVLGSRLSPAQITADQNNYSPTDLYGAGVLNINSNAARTITGLDSNSNARAGALLWVCNNGSFNITLSHESASSLAGNRFHFSGGVDVVLEPDDVILLYEDNIITRWRDLSRTSISHGELRNLTTGDDHTQYAKLNGRSGGQTLRGGTTTQQQLSLTGSSTGDGAVVLVDGVSLYNTISPSTLTSDQNDYSPTGLEGTVILQLQSNSSDRKVTGLVPPGSGVADVHGRLICLINTGTFDLILSHQSASSTVSNRFSFPNNVDLVLGPNGSVMLWYDNIAGHWQGMSIPRQVTPLPTLYRQGLTWKRDGTDTTNKVNIAAGSCRSSDDTYNIVLPAITKSLAGTWVVGTGNGLDTGTRANSTWYYLWAIARSDTGVCDVLLSTSNSAPTMPTSYDKKRLIGAIRTGASLLDQVSVRQFGPGGLFVHYLDPFTIGFSINTASLSTARSNSTLAVPLMPNAGDFTIAKCNIMVSSATVGVKVWFYTPDVTDAAPSNSTQPGSGGGSLVANQTTDQVSDLVVDHNAQISARASAASTGLKLQVLGYWWPGYL